MPVATRMARKSDRSPARYLMLLAFSVHFGGMMILISHPDWAPIERDGVVVGRV
jgi:Na+/H+ antiporter NhaD/arsenite permease-like protein